MPLELTKLKLILRLKFNFLRQLRTYYLRTDVLLEETSVHASKTGTFIVGNSLRVHSSRAPKPESLPRNGAGANQSNAAAPHAAGVRTRYYLFSSCQNLKFTAEWEDANQSNESSTKCTRTRCHQNLNINFYRRMART